MERSDGVRDLILRFYGAVTAGDVARFDELVSAHPSTLVIGTAPGEWVRERDRLLFGFEAEGVGWENGDPEAHEEGDLGWATDRPTMRFPGGLQVHVRVTAVAHREGGTWKLVHLHASAGVPDDEVADLQARWGVEAGTG